MKQLRVRTGSGVSLFACAVCALGLLLWARLLLVSSPPRIATADTVAGTPSASAGRLPPASAAVCRTPTERYLDARDYKLQTR